MPADVFAFIHDLAPGDIPETARHAGGRALLDTLGTAATGSATEASRILRGYAARFHPAGASGARLLFDGRRVAPPGAAMAGAGSIDAIDAHDGHRLTKGHVGVTVVPALLACCDELARCDGPEFLTRLVIGYEIGTRAGIALHATAADYHTSGAWNALAAAAIAARALRLSPQETAHTLGIAEYYGPRSQMMRVIDHPTMLKDGSAFGALGGMTAALLAAEGFTGAPAVTLTGPEVAEVWCDLGGRWRVQEQYIKAYPVCRWAQPAIEAALSLRGAALRPEEIAQVTIHSFSEATRLAGRHPQSTDEAQYALPFPVAAALVHGRLGVTEIDGPGLHDPRVLALSDKIEMIEDRDYSARFPEERWARAEITLADGRRLVSKPCPARGDPEAPFSDAELVEKFHGLAEPLLGAAETATLAEHCLAIDSCNDLSVFLDRLLAAPGARAGAAQVSSIR